MITANVGRLFVQAYNEREGTSWTAKEFFEKVYHPLFLGREKYLLYHKNSEFVQKVKAVEKSKFKSFDDEVDYRLNSFFKKVEEGYRDDSVAVSYPASDLKEFATTSGGVTDIVREIPEEEVYESWIGAGFGVTVAGGVSILFTEIEVLWALFEGWQVYRLLLNDPVNYKLAGNKIGAWNGQWLHYRLSKRFSPDYDFSVLQDHQFFTDEKDGVIAIQTIKWSLLFVNLSQLLGAKTISAYLYAIGQTNKTIGFVPFQLKAGRSIKAVYKKLFGEEDTQGFSDISFERLLGEDIFQVAKLGTVGLQALRPEKLRDYFKADKPMMKFKQNPVKQKSGESEEAYQQRLDKANKDQVQKKITYRTYKTWMEAMLTRNNEELLDYTTTVAETLHAYRSKATKNDRKNRIEEELLKAGNKKKFIDTIAEIVRDADETLLDQLKEITKTVHLMTPDEFGYFLTLTKFDYAYQDRKN